MKLRTLIFTVFVSLFAVLSMQAAAQVVRVGSKNFTEQFVLAEIYAQALEAAGMKVETKTQDQGAYVGRIFGKVGDFQVACFRTNQFVEPDQLRAAECPGEAEEEVLV